MVAVLVGLGATAAGAAGDEADAAAVVVDPELAVRCAGFRSITGLFGGTGGGTGRSAGLPAAVRAEYKLGIDGRFAHKKRKVIIECSDVSSEAYL